jgi:hypothetical protein
MIFEVNIVPQISVELIIHSPIELVRTRQNT